MERYDEIGQKNRAKQINDLVLQYHLKDVNPDGTLSGEKWKRCGLKELFWFCEAAWNTSAEYASLTEKMLLQHPEFERFHTFVPFMCMVNLLKNGSRLTPKLTQRFEEYVRAMMPVNLRHDWDFVGVNDNTPAMIMTCCILAGEHFSEPEWKRTGLARLEAFSQMLERRGFTSEFNSPTYTPITIYALAMLAELARDEEVKKLALSCETRMWEQVIPLYQSEACNLAGPYSRAYEEDRRCRTYNIRYLFYALLGDACAITPLNTVFRGQKQTDFYFQLANVWIANGMYHCPKALAETVFRRNYPYVVRGTAEVSVSADTYLVPCLGGNDMTIENLTRTDYGNLFEQNDLFEYPAATVNLYTWMDRDYSMGTCSRPFHNGSQTDSFMVLYSKNGGASSEEEIGTVFATYVINQEIDFRNDAGRKVALQNENSAMVLYRPCPCSKEVETAKLQIVCDNLSTGINSAWCEGTVISKQELMQPGFCKTLDGLNPICVETESVYLFFLPMIAERDRPDAVIELKHIENTLCLNFYNYKGKARKFANKELCLKTNGFVCEVRKKSAYKNLCEFAEDMIGGCERSDLMRTNLHARYAFTRESGYRNRDTGFQVCYSPLSEGFRYCMVNGREPYPVKFEIKSKGEKEHVI